MYTEDYKKAFAAVSAKFGYLTFAAGYLLFEICFYPIRKLLGLKSPRFNQRNSKFAEGSIPTLGTPLGTEINRLLQYLFCLATNTTYKVAMDGALQPAAGLIVVDRATGEFLLAVKGDPYNKGKIGVIGGQGSDVDKADPMAMFLREKGEELGKYLFAKDRLINLLTTQEWRTVDSRGEYGIWSQFFVYCADAEEIDKIVASFNRFMRSQEPDPDREVVQLVRLSRRKVLELIRDGKMGYFDQTQAFVMVNLVLAALGNIPQDGFGTPLTDVQRWLMAKALVIHQFEQLTDVTGGDWRPKINPDDPAFNLALYE